MKFVPYFFAMLTALLLLALFFIALPDLNTCRLPGEAPSAPSGRRRAAFSGEDRSRRLSRADVLPILAVTLLYALTAFFRLGCTAAPQSFVPMEERSVELALEEGSRPRTLLLYAGVGQGRYVVNCLGADGLSSQPEFFEQDHIAVLKWNRVELPEDERIASIHIRCLSGSPWLGELLVLDAEGAPIPFRCEIPELCDEQDRRPDAPDFLRSSYFDEIYHARTAWEHLHGVRPYEVTHPPLGKEIIGLGILLFGMTPFGWRFSGTLFGVLMLPLLYLFLKKLFGGRWVPALGTVIFAADFMHYVQTRIATIDTYSVFFILLMYLFLYLWLTEDKLWALALCGVSFGLGAAAKWTSIYAGIGLALLWLAKWIRRFVRAGKAARAQDAGRKSARRLAAVVLGLLLGLGLPGLAALLLLRQGRENLLFQILCAASLLGLLFWIGALILAGRKRRKAGNAEQPSGADETDPARLPLAFLCNVLFCLEFFIAVPALIYYFSYLPYCAAFGAGPFTGQYLHLVVGNQVNMFTYHSRSVLGATHPYSSHWYQWLLDIRPILYVLEYPSETTKISIAAFLNPVLCWGGLLCLPLLGYMAIARRDRRAAFLLVGYLSQLLPWVGITRLTFAYHYFPSSIFLVLSLGYLIALLRENKPGWKGAGLALAGGSLLLFLLFFPALNGLEIGRGLGSALMRWLPTWPL